MLRRQSEITKSGRHLHVVLPGNTAKVLLRSAFLSSRGDSVKNNFSDPVRRIAWEWDGGGFVDHHSSKVLFYNNDFILNRL